MIIKYRINRKKILMINFFLTIFVTIVIFLVILFSTKIILNRKRNSNKFKLIKSNDFSKNKHKWIKSTKAGLYYCNVI